MSILKCGICGEEKEDFAAVHLRVGVKEVKASACKECFDSSMRKQTGFRMMIANFLPEEWKAVIFNG